MIRFLLHPTWLARLLVIAYLIEVGLLLVLVPWSLFWDHNYFADAIPALGVLARNSFVRGAVSGLGLVTVAAGLVDLYALLRRGD